MWLHNILWSKCWVKTPKSSSCMSASFKLSSISISGSKLSRLLSLSSTTSSGKRYGNENKGKKNFPLSNAQRLGTTFSLMTVSKAQGTHLPWYLHPSCFASCSLTALPCWSHSSHHIQLSFSRLWFLLAPVMCHSFGWSCKLHMSLITVFSDTLF